MLDRRDLEPVFFAPFVSSLMKVEPAWIDYNGHLNMAYHNVLFDRAVDEVFELLGCGANYVKKGFSTFDFLLRFTSPARRGDLVRVKTGLLHLGSSSMRMLHRMTNAVSGAPIATLEQSGVHLDLDARRPMPLPDEMRKRAQALLVR